MNLLRHNDPDFQERKSKLAAASSLFDPVIEQRTRDILEQVRLRGDTALSEFTQRFDGAQLAPEQFAVTSAERFNASVAADDSLRAAAELAHRNIEHIEKSHKGVKSKGVKSPHFTFTHSRSRRPQIAIPSASAARFAISNSLRSARSLFS